jgi:SAM-dependent methyltransferase
MIKEKIKKKLSNWNWNEQRRVEWVENTIRSIPAAAVILDAGAGERRYKDACSHLKYIAQDFGQYDGKGNIGLQMGSWNNDGLDIVCDITNIPLPDNSIDVILCTEVFEHLPNPVYAIKEFSRLLKPEGKLILSAPFASFVHFAPYHFYSGFSRYFYEKHLCENGFEIEKLEFNGNFFEYLTQEIWRTPYMCRKYINKASSILSKFLLFPTIFLLLFLQRMSKRENTKGEGSQETVCFGCHVLAKKMK